VRAEAELRFAPVRDHAAVVADAAVWDNGYLATAERPDGAQQVVAAPVRFSATPAEPPAFAPELGQHTEEVLLELGYSWADISALGEAGVV
jgi:crotonobetainyl-CoA:carnitine CoA-transferase CaiB-like acyl-CoA transferase